MTRNWIKALGILCIVVVTSAARAGTITVSAAISMKEALVDIAKQYESDTGEHVEFSFGASGQLAAQILQGAPVDLFISAGQTPINTLRDKGLIEEPRTLVRNALVLIVPRDAKDAPTTVADLATARVRRIAIGDAKTVPAGEYAAQALASLKLDASLKDKLIGAANVRQVLAYVQRGEVDAGFVYATDAQEAGDAVRVVATIDPALHAPIVYPGAVVKASAHHPDAQRFLDYVAGDKAQAALTNRGFLRAVMPATSTSPAHE